MSGSPEIVAAVDGEPAHAFTARNSPSVSAAAWTPDEGNTCVALPGVAAIGPSLCESESGEVGLVGGKRLPS